MGRVLSRVLLSRIRTPKMDDRAAADCQERGVVFVHREMTASTMDDGKELCAKHPKCDILVVSADQQSAGRGTRGRGWTSPKGNVYTSICVRKDLLPIKRLMHFPLEVGLCILHALLDHLPPSVTTPHPQHKGRLPACDRPQQMLSLKWPNDILLGDHKVSGTLIEDAGSHLVVGIGINVAVAPEVADGGRQAACLKDAGCDAGPLEIVKRITSMLHEPTFKGDIVTQYAELMDWNAPVYERKPDFTRGAELQAVKLLPEGHLLVRNKETGAEKKLINEYLF
eukprot:Sspe_Gene.54183::Locus_29918_Transcript_1_3_Confidence_0.400_Length_977::g.54183::m.54183/K03524/birA; BirA family transcriptional regulator, biotin operon repressor / biotin-[acetyl-CoA-carboxylase] ligase